MKTTVTGITVSQSRGAVQDPISPIPRQRSGCNGHIESQAGALDAYRYAETEARHESHELFHREAADLLVDEGGDVRLVEAQEFAREWILFPQLF